MAGVDTVNIGVVVPAFNEAEIIADAVRRLTGVPVVVADGGSSDTTAELAREAGAAVVVSRGGRGVRQNVGAAALSDADVFVFLHADTRLPAEWESHVAATLVEGVAIGAFRLAIEDATAAQRLVASGANLRSRWFKLPYGDQALFMRRETFAALGGFRDLPIMEDFDLVRRARHFGRIAFAEAAVMTSARRWRRRGVFGTTLVNQLMLAGWMLGASPDRLARFYRSR